MATRIEDKGHLFESSKPLRPRWYRPGRLPDAAQCAGSIIGINDSEDGNPRGRLAISNGASWDSLAYVGDSGGPVYVPATVPHQQDITALVNMAVADAMRSLPRPDHRSLAPPPLPASAQPDEMKALAAAVLEMSGIIEALQQRIEFIEQHAIARAELK
jgi:hypothetical protein